MGWKPNLKIRNTVQMHFLLKKEKSVYIFHFSVVTGLILGDRTSQVCVLDTEILGIRKKCEYLEVVQRTAFRSRESFLHEIPGHFTF